MDILNFVAGEWVKGGAPTTTTTSIADADRMLKDPNTNQPRVDLPVPNILLEEDETHAGCWSREYGMGTISPKMFSACEDITKKAVEFALQPHQFKMPTGASAAERTQDDEWFGIDNLEQRRDALLNLGKLFEEDPSLPAALTLPDSFEVGLPRYYTKFIASTFSMVVPHSVNQCYAELAHQNSRKLHGMAMPETSPNKELQQAIGGIHCQRLPHPVVAIVAPWNVPIGTILSKLLAALLCGCSVILKPSEFAPTSVTLLVRLMEVLRLPAAALQLLQGDGTVGHILTTHPKVTCVQFTGRSVTASKIACAVAPRLGAFQAECGGSNAALLLPNADVDAALPHLAKGICFINGQWCMGLSRIFVHEEVKEIFLQKLLAYMNATVTACASHSERPNFAEHDSTSPVKQTKPVEEFGENDVLEPAVEDHILVGPVAFEEHANHLRDLMQRIGGTSIAVGGCNSDAGLQRSPCFVQPTIVVDGDVTVSSQQEAFGPVVSLHTYTTIQQAVDMVNLASGQLCCYLFAHPSGQVTSTPGGEVSPASLNHIRFGLSSGHVMLNSVAFGLHPGEDDHKNKELEHHEHQLPPTLEFSGTAGYGKDGNAPALVELFTVSRWSGIGAP